MADRARAGRSDEFVVAIVAPIQVTCFEVLDVARAEEEADLAGRTGVIFFKDYWTRGNEPFANRSGDHIDLWNKSRISGASMLYRALIEMLGLVSDLNKSKAVWFWEVK